MGQGPYVRCIQRLWKINAKEGLFASQMHGPKYTERKVECSLPLCIVIFDFKLESRAYQPKVNVQVHVLSEVQSGELTKELSIDKSVVLGE